VVIEASLTTTIQDIANESRSNGIVPRYVLDEKNADIVGFDIYFSSLILEFSENLII